MDLEARLRAAARQGPQRAGARRSTAAASAPRSLRAGITTETHGEEIAKLLYFHDLKDAVLVGTSSGGMVMACAAEQARERVARVVFADALALLDGEKILDIVKRPTTAIDTPLARGPSREDAAGRLFAGLDPALREWAADRVTLHPAAVYNQPVKLAAVLGPDSGTPTCSTAAAPPTPARRISGARPTSSRRAGT